MFYFDGVSNVYCEELYNKRFSSKRFKKVSVDCMLNNIMWLDTKYNILTNHLNNKETDILVNVFYLESYQEMYRSPIDYNTYRVLVINTDTYLEFINIWTSTNVLSNSVDILLCDEHQLLSILGDFIYNIKRKGGNVYICKFLLDGVRPFYVVRHDFIHSIDFYYICAFKDGTTYISYDMAGILNKLYKIKETVKGSIKVESMLC